MMKVDYLIVGAGLAGAVAAERLASQAGKRVLLVDKRDHTGGNCHDFYNEHGILVHKYGPHYFRTNSKRVFDYLSQFTDWHYVQYRIKAMVDGRLLPLPINLDTVNELYGYTFSSDDLKRYFSRLGRKSGAIRNSEEAVLAKVGKDLYEKLYRSYTVKQWGIEPRDLAASVCERIPVRLNRDDRYFTDKYQAMPKAGYHILFQNLLRNPRIHIMLQTDYRDIREMIPHKQLIFTGPIDEFFNYKYGKLPYRSLRFEHETHDVEHYQPVSQVNYPMDYDFTRIVEIKHATGQRHEKTTVVREYPAAEGDPFYPVPTPANDKTYGRYKKEADKLENVHFIGRLAQYRYMNMDQAVMEALNLFDKLSCGR